MHTLSNQKESTVPPKLGDMKAKSESRILGKVELRYVSVDDLIFFVELLDKVEGDREFVIQVLYHQLIRPRVSFAAFNKITDDELTRLARNFVRQEQYAFRDFKETTDAEVFSNFRKAINRCGQRVVGQVLAAVEPVIESMKSLGRVAVQIFEATALTLTEALAPQVEFWHNFLDKYETTEQEAIQILGEYKWLTTLSLPLNFVFEVVRIGRRRDNPFKAVNRLFVDYFSSNDFAKLEILVDGWETNTLFKPRMKIFRDCISALRSARSDYNPSNLVLPPLIAQIEGIKTEFMKQKGLSDEEIKWNWKAWLRGQTSSQRLLSQANDILVNILFQKSERGKPLEIPFTFSRHKIMHGEQYRYGRIDNTIRAFLILDFLATLSNDWLGP